MLKQPAAKIIIQSPNPEGAPPKGPSDFDLHIWTGIVIPDQNITFILTVLKLVKIEALSWREKKGDKVLA